MTAFPRRFLLLPLALLLPIVAGCGSQASSNTQPSATSLPTVATTPPPLGTPTVPATPVVSGSVAAVVNGNNVPISTFRLRLNLAVRSGRGQTAKALAPQVMQEVIYNELVREYAAVHHLTVTAAELTAQERQDVLRAGGQARFNSELTQFGLTPTLYRTLVEPNLLARKVEKIIVPLKPARSDAAAHALALTILHQLQHGGSFKALARKYSEDPGSAAQGGDLGTVFPHQMVAQFDQASFHTPIKKYVIVHTQFGYHIVQVIARGTAVQPGSPAGTAPVATAHVRHILISTQPQGLQTQQTRFVAWLHTKQLHSQIKRVAQVIG